MRAQAAQEEEVLAEGASDLESDECSGEYETDSDEDARQLLKPTFTQKRDRETIAERERIAQEEARVAAERSKQLELRKGETKSLVIDRLRVRCQGLQSCAAGLSQRRRACCTTSSTSLLVRGCSACEHIM